MRSKVSVIQELGSLSKGVRMSLVSTPTIHFNISKQS